jgi:hypothetical protein
MTWSREEALEQRKKALRLLLEDGGYDFTRALEWRDGPTVPDGVWSLLLSEGLVDCYALGGTSWRLNVDGWIEACRLLRDEVGLDKRFGDLSKYLSDLNPTRAGFYTTVGAITANTGLNEFWVFDAIGGRMAERIFRKHGATVHPMSGDVEIPPHFGNPL